ncbi:MAG: ParM/StbA family protein [Tepidanaerobacteraceae bacterium]|jgi:plasmid segregation protein ParM|nr:ParM/StbA family protein [Tepidanaerobacteraceae bacterium]
MARLIGIDVGYGFVKVTDGEAGYSFPSVVGEGHTRPTFNTGADRFSTIDHLKVGMGKKIYFVGKAAIKHSRFVYRDLSYNRSAGEDFEILFFSALSFFADAAYNEFNVVTGLPVERMHMADSLAKRVKGERSIALFVEGGSREIRLNVKEVEIVPQPLGTYWSLFSGPMGLDAAAPAEGRIGIVDIGFRTTDLAALEDSEFIPEKSKSLTVGLATAYSEIGLSIAARYGLEKESYSLDGIVIKRRINMAGESIDITDIVSEAFEKLATNILVEVNSQWRLSDFDSIILSGGGGQAISQYLLPRISHAKLAADPITANCRGYLAWANRLWNSPSRIGQPQEEYTPQS